MLMNLGDIIARHGMKITGILHVGAHLGEEAMAYYENGIYNVVWIEGNPELIPNLVANVEPFGHRVYQALVGDEDNKEVTFHITNNGQSSSVLDFGTHAKVSPDVHFIGDQTHRMTTLDTMMDQEGFEGCNFLNMDLQGAELLALKGAEELLKQVDYIFTEINVDELYIDCARLPQLDEFLEERGFKRVEMVLAGSRENWVGWGDALYIRK